MANAAICRVFVCCHVENALKIRNVRVVRLAFPRKILLVRSLIGSQILETCRKLRRAWEIADLEHASRGWKQRIDGSSATVDRKRSCEDSVVDFLRNIVTNFSIFCSNERC